MTEEKYKQERDLLIEELQNALSSRYFVFLKVIQINRALERLEREYRGEK